MRFDLRAPGATAAERAALHRSAIEMSQWADGKGCVSVVLSEHHASDDGYLPSPLTLAAAIAAVTSTVQISVAATLLPLHDPVHLAEQLITLDYISNGRAMVVLGVGYRREEYDLFGVDFSKRGKIADDKLAVLLDALNTAGSDSATPVVTPAPFSSPHPMLAWGGRSAVAAKRAGRNGLHFFAQTDEPGLRELYRDTAIANGHKPGMCLLPDPANPLVSFVSDDADAAWDEVGERLLVDAMAYHAWNDAAGTVEGTASLSSAQNVADLRAANGAHRVVSAAEAREVAATYGILGLHPLVGGLDPEVGWKYLRNAVDAFA